MRLSKKLLHLLFVLSVSTLPQLTLSQPKEIIQELTKAARKGILVDTKMDQENKLRITFKMKVDKKSDEVNYEDYVFDQDLNYQGIQPSKVDKVVKPNDQRTSLYAYVGGTNSFTVLSMDITFKKVTYERIWNVDKQQYYWGKRLSSDVVKPSNSDTKYKGFASYENDDDGSVLVLASAKAKKDDDNQFVFLHMSQSLSLTETKIPLTGENSLVYTSSLKSGNVFAIFAPKKGMPDFTKYTYVEADNKGNIVHNREFKAPATATVIMGLCRS